MSGNNDETETLLFETSPWGNVDAIVEHDGRCVYFYLNSRETFGTRACWVANLVAGPLVFSESDMAEGIPPLLPRIHSVYPDGRNLAADSLSVVWFEEGNGAALTETGEPVCVIPPWSGAEGFHGYARDCVAETPVAWPMPVEGALRARIDRAAAFWKSDPSLLFGDLQQQLLSLYEAEFGAIVQYWAADGAAFPPRGLAAFRKNGKLTFTTVGMSFVPQPNVELYTDHPEQFRRIELILQVQETSGNPPGERVDLEAVARRLSGLAATPWKRMTWYGPEHTCELSLPASLFKLNGERVVTEEVGEFEKRIARFTSLTTMQAMFRDDPILFLHIQPTGCDGTSSG